MFIHDALMEAIVAGSSEVAARALHAHIQLLMQPLPDAETVTGMEAEFKVTQCFYNTNNIYFNIYIILDYPWAVGSN